MRKRRRGIDKLEAPNVYKIHGNLTISLNGTGVSLQGWELEHTKFKQTFDFTSLPRRVIIEEIEDNNNVDGEESDESRD